MLTYFIIGNILTIIESIINMKVIKENLNDVQEDKHPFGVFIGAFIAALILIVLWPVVLPVFIFNFVKNLES